MMKIGWQQRKKPPTNPRAFWCTLSLLLSTLIIVTLMFGSLNLIPSTWRLSNPTKRGMWGPTALAPSTNANVHLFLFQQDEDGLLMDWLTYHVKVFGIESVHVIDNNSTSYLTQMTLRYWQHKGLGIHYYKGDSGFLNKQDIFNAYIQTVLEKNSDMKKIDFLVPLDADEFLVARTPTGFAVGRAAIQRAFAALPRTGKKYKLAQFMARICDESAVSYTGLSMRPVVELRHFAEMPTTCLSKTFYWKEGFLSTDAGNHLGMVSTLPQRCNEAVHNTTNLEPCKECFEESELGYLDFGRTLYASHKKKNTRGAFAGGQGEVFRQSGTQRECNEMINDVHYCWFFKDIATHGEDNVRKWYYQGHFHDCMKYNLQEDTSLADCVLGFSSLSV